MEAEDPLKELRDIHLPDAVAFWPPAPGWWVLLVLVLVILAFLGHRYFLALIRRRKLASALAELDAALTSFNELSTLDSTRNQAGLDFLSTVNVLLKRVAQVNYPAAGSGKLTGRHWLTFLDSCDNTQDFTTGVGQPLGDGIYRRDFDADAQAIHELVRRWIENRYRSKQVIPVQQEQTA